MTRAILSMSSYTTNNDISDGLRDKFVIKRFVHYAYEMGVVFKQF